MGSRLLDHPIPLIILILLVIVLFGWKRLPDAARSLGRSSRILKSEMEQMKLDGNGKNEEKEALKKEDEAVSKDAQMDLHNVDEIDTPKPL